MLLSSRALLPLRATRALSTQANHVAPRRRWRGPVLGLVTLGAGTFGYVQTQAVLEFDRKLNEGKEPFEQIPSNWQVTLLRTIPTRAMSRAWGVMTHVPLPEFMRPLVYGGWALFFGSDLNEMKAQDLKEFPSLADFFVRTLKEDARPIDGSPLVCPSDGRVMHLGTVENGLIEQVKGIEYSARGFLGERLETKNPNNQFYQIVIYLAPGDYHRFHSSVSWDVESRKHFPGELISVNPGFVRMVRGLFIFNERVVLRGAWQHGYFSYTAVGATNVGSIKIAFDDDLDTNNPSAQLDGTYIEKRYGAKRVEKGEEVGSFNLGSTIILVFEAPKGFEFGVRPGERVKVGQALGTFGKQ